MGPAFCVARKGGSCWGTSAQTGTYPTRSRVVRSTPVAAAAKGPRRCGARRGGGPHQSQRSQQPTPPHPHWCWVGKHVPLIMHGQLTRVAPLIQLLGAIAAAWAVCVDRTCSLSMLNSGIAGRDPRPQASRGFARRWGA